MEETLIIEIPYYGLGDHLFHSHLPRIAKETGRYSKVLISEKSLFRQADTRRIVWELNPFVDGFIDIEGVSCDVSRLVKIVSDGMMNQVNSTTNLLDEIMLQYGLDDKSRWHDPEIYYKPKFIKNFQKSVFDPNFFSYVGEVNIADMNYYLKKNNLHFDKVMKSISPRPLHNYNSKTKYISTPSLGSFCDLIFSCNKLYCLTSGTATLAAALNKPATVFWGENQHLGFQHSKLHNYIKIPFSPYTQFLNVIKYPYRYIRYELLKMAISVYLRH